MEVYRDHSPLTAIPVNHTFLWEEQEIFIPAVYTGSTGAVLDVCARIPTEDMASFLEKWNYERRISLKTPEDWEQIDADNPGSREFAVEMCFDGTQLVRRMSSSLRWYPKNVIGMADAGPDGEAGFKNPASAEKWMDEYHRDRECCWYFERLSYDWDSEPILHPRKISLTFMAGFLSITAGHFSTDSLCDGRTIRTAHPVTGQEYTISLHGCEPARHSFAEIGAKGVVYPEYCQILSYSVAPETDHSLFDIRDCAEGDHPGTGTLAKESVSPGPTALFLAGKNAAPDRRTAVSALHFEPVSDIQWRIVFQIKPKDDLEICLDAGQTIRC